ncbi:uncharacterized protein [Eurosta solidaginis]|uniref:uncharacterized protein n=1 Tax=Eurosta solidaginis TaxID=178769 RepID=UPI003530757F
MDYAASTFAKIPKSALQKLSICSNTNLRRCLGLIRSTPTHVIYHMAAEMPTSYRIEMATAKEIIKCIAYNLPMKKIIITDKLSKNTSYYKIYQKYKLIFYNIATINTKKQSLRKIVTDDNFFKNTAKNKECNKNIINTILKEKIHLLESQQFELIFTDGSIKDNIMGAAFIHEKSNTTKSFYSNKKVASMTAELIAIQKAVEFAIIQNFKKIAILTDSLSSIFAIKNEESNNHIVQEIIEIINASNLDKIEIHYIPAHKNINQNEKADEAAKNANQNGERIRIPWTIKDAIKEIENKIRKEWETEYKGKITNKGKDYGQIYPEIIKKPWFQKKNTKLESRDIKVINRILSNHTFCKDTLNKMNIYDDNSCETCNTIENTNHILFHCNKYANIRSKYPLLQNHTTLIDIQKKYGDKMYNTITSFLKQCKLEL